MTYFFAVIVFSLVFPAFLRFIENKFRIKPEKLTQKIETPENNSDSQIIYSYKNNTIVKFSRNKLLIQLSLSSGGLLRRGEYRYSLDKTRHIGYASFIGGLKLIFVSNNGGVDFSVGLPMKQEESAQFVTRFVKITGFEIVPDTDLINLMKKDYQDIISGRLKPEIDTQTAFAALGTTKSAIYYWGIILIGIAVMLIFYPGKGVNEYLWLLAIVSLGILLMLVGSLKGFMSSVSIGEKGIAYNKFPLVWRKRLLFNDFKKLVVFYNRFTMSGKIGKEKAVGGKGGHQLIFKTVEGKGLTFPFELEEFQNPYSFLWVLLQRSGIQAEYHG